MAAEARMRLLLLDGLALIFLLGSLVLLSRLLRGRALAEQGWILLQAGLGALSFTALAWTLGDADRLGMRLPVPAEILGGSVDLILLPLAAICFVVALLDWR